MMCDSTNSSSSTIPRDLVVLGDTSTLQQKIINEKEEKKSSKIEQQKLKISMIGLKLKLMRRDSSLDLSDEQRKDLSFQIKTQIRLLKLARLDLRTLQREV